MTARHDTLPLLARSGMELSWRYAWSLFLYLLVTGRPFPFLPAVCTLAMAALLSHLTAIKRVRMILAIGAQAAGFTVCTLVALHPGHSQGLSFFNPDWIGGLLLIAKTPGQWFAPVLLVLCQLLIWRGGQVLVKAPDHYDAVCMQFDKGLGLLFFLLIAKSLFERRGGLDLPIPSIGFTALAFLIFSLIAIGLTRNDGRAQKTFLSGYHAAGLFLSGTAMVVFFGAGLTFLTFPCLYHMADLLLASIDHTTEPVIPLLIRFLLYFLKPKKMMPSPSSDIAAPGSKLAPAEAVNEGGDLLRMVVGSGLSIVVGLAAAVILGLLLKRLIGWLMKTPPRGGEEHASATRLLFWIRFLAHLPVMLLKRLTACFKGTASAGTAYAAMRSWGRRSGLLCSPNETPAEYGDKLLLHFPQLGADIHLIVEAFNLETYGQIKTDGNTLSRIKAANRRMRHVRYWPVRLKVRLSMENRWKIRPEVSG